MSQKGKELFGVMATLDLNLVPSHSVVCNVTYFNFTSLLLFPFTPFKHRNFFLHTSTLYMIF